MGCSVQRHGSSGSGGVVGNDIQLHHRDGTDEMSVAIDLAKLSQGHYTSNDFRHTNNSISLGKIPSLQHGPWSLLTQEKFAKLGTN